MPYCNNPDMFAGFKADYVIVPVHYFLLLSTYYSYYFYTNTRERTDQYVFDTTISVMLHFRLHCTNLDCDGYLCMYEIDDFYEERL